MNSIFSFGTPLLAVAACMLVVPTALAPQARLSGAVTLFGALLLTAAVMLVTGRSAILTNFTPADGTVATLMLLIAGLAIAPLADRARPASLILAAPIAAYAVLSTLFAFGVPADSMVAASMVAITLSALIGSALLPAHPARYSVTGQLRGIATAQPVLLLGWVLLAAALLALMVLLRAAPDCTLALLAAIIAALTTLLTTHTEDGLAKAGEAIAAAVLLTSCAVLTMPLAVMAGLAAAFCVNRSEALTVALRIDDPQHVTGALLLPAIGALLLPGGVDTAQLGSQIVWLGIAIVTGLALAALLWPIMMLVTGLALPKRRVLEGLRAG